MGPTRPRHTEQGRGLTGGKLVDSEVTDGEVGTNVFPILFRTYRYPRFARRITGMTLLASMAARRRRTVVNSPSLVKM